MQSENTFSTSFLGLESRFAAVFGIAIDRSPWPTFFELCMLNKYNDQITVKVDSIEC